LTAKLTILNLSLFFFSCGHSGCSKNFTTADHPVAMMEPFGGRTPLGGRMKQLFGAVV
jgi:hypothetical protein